MHKKQLDSRQFWKNVYVISDFQFGKRNIWNFQNVNIILIYAFHIQE